MQLCWLVVGAFVPWLAVMGALASLVALFVFGPQRLILAPRPVVMLLRDGRLTVGDRSFPTWDVTGARWDCDETETTLVLEHADGTETPVARVLRQTATTEGITRRQREWIVELLRRDELQVAEDVPDAMRQLQREARARGLDH